MGDRSAARVAERKAEILRAASEKNLDGIERKDLQSRDLLTLLMKANMAKDIPNEQRLSDADVINREPYNTSSSRHSRLTR